MKKWIFSATLITFFISFVSHSQESIASSENSSNGELQLNGELLKVQKVSKLQGAIDYLSDWN